MLIAYVTGIVLALAVAGYAMLVGLDRDRAFYSTVVIVVASYYVLFAAISGDVHTLIQEALVVSIFLAVAAAGFKRSSWLIVAALAAHGVLDIFHGSVILNSGVPSWWPDFCMTYDLTASAFLAWRLHRSPSLGGPRHEVEA